MDAWICITGWIYSFRHHINICEFTVKCLAYFPSDSIFFATLDCFNVAAIFKLLFWTCGDINFYIKPTLCAETVTDVPPSSHWQFLGEESTVSNDQGANAPSKERKQDCAWPFLLLIFTVLHTKNSLPMVIQCAVLLQCDPTHLLHLAG